MGSRGGELWQGLLINGSRNGKGNNAEHNDRKGNKCRLAITIIVITITMTVIVSVERTMQNHQLPTQPSRGAVRTLKGPPLRHIATAVFPERQRAAQLAESM